ncbi:MAG: extracellular solute-binding protein [Aristaeellaceae bacterium]
MKHWTKLLSLLMAMSLLLAACGPALAEGETFEENGRTFYKTGVRITDEELVLTGFGSRYSGNADWDQNMLLFSELLARTGVRIDFETVVTGEARTKCQALFAADDLPDLLAKNALNATDVTKFAQSGQLVNLKPFMDEGLMPNFTELYNSDVNVRIACTEADGGVYALPCVYTDSLDTTRRFMYINERWLENVGLEKPRTIDEFLTVLRAFRDQDANGNGDPTDEYPVSFGDAVAQMERTARALAGIDNVFGQPYNVIDGSIQQMYTSEQMKEAFRFMHTLYSEGLIEQDIFTRSATDFFARMNDDKFGVTLLLPGTGSESFGVLEPSFGLFGEGTTLWCWNQSPVLTSMTFAITSANKYPRATARLMDYFYGEEGATLVRMGVEGVTYVVNEDGSLSYTEAIRNDPQGIEFAMAQHSFWLGTNTVPGKYSARLTAPSIEGTVMLECPEIFAGYLSRYAYSTPVLSNSLNKEKTSLQSEINNYYTEARAKFITGELDIDKDWDAYVQQLESMDLARLEEIYGIMYQQVLDMMN